jgi:putative ABC transport system permease protein
MWRWNWLEHLVQDVRFALRMLVKNSSFAAVAVVTLALGIGANTAIFSFLDAALNLHFPIKDQDRIVNLWSSTISAGSRNSLSIPDFLDYRQQNRVFEDLAAYSGETFQLPTRLGLSVWRAIGHASTIFTCWASNRQLAAISCPKSLTGVTGLRS